MSTPKKTPAKRKKRIAATTICRKVVHVPGTNKTTGRLLKGWKYKNGIPVKVTAVTKKAKPKKAGLKKPSTKQSAAQKRFAANAKKARQLVSSGKAKNLKAAWAMIK